jgi:hypothetical protein
MGQTVGVREHGTRHAHAGCLALHGHQEASDAVVVHPVVTIVVRSRSVARGRVHDLSTISCASNLLPRGSKCNKLMVHRGMADSQRQTSPSTRKRRTQRARIRRRRGCRDTVAQRTLPCMKQPKNRTIAPACVAQLDRQGVYVGQARAAKKRGSVSCIPTRDGCGSVIPTWQHHSVQQVLHGEYIPNLVRDSSDVTTHVRARITPSMRSPATLHRACTLHTLAYAINHHTTTERQSRTTADL